MRDGLGVFRGRLSLYRGGSYSNRYSNADRLGAGATVGETEHNLCQVVPMRRRLAQRDWSLVASEERAMPRRR